MVKKQKIIQLSTRKVTVRLDGTIDKRSLRGKPLSDKEEIELQKILNQDEEEISLSSDESSDDDEIEVIPKKEVKRKIQKKATKLAQEKQQKSENKKLQMLEKQFNEMQLKYQDLLDKQKKTETFCDKEEKLEKKTDIKAARDEVKRPFQKFNGFAF